MLKVLTILTILNSGAIAAAILRFRKSSSADPCAIKHALVIVAAQPLKSEFQLLHEQTITLQRCRNCGIHISVNYAGNWQLEDFCKSELKDFLEGMYK